MIGRNIDNASDVVVDLPGGHGQFNNGGYPEPAQIILNNLSEINVRLNGDVLDIGDATIRGSSWVRCISCCLDYLLVSGCGGISNHLARLIVEGDHVISPRNKKLLIVILRHELDVCVHERVEIAHASQMIHPLGQIELALVLFQFAHSRKINKGSTLGVHVPMNDLGRHELLASFEVHLPHLANLQSIP